MVFFAFGKCFPVVLSCARGGMAGFGAFMCESDAEKRMKVQGNAV